MSSESVPPSPNPATAAREARATTSHAAELGAGVVTGAYPERKEERLSGLDEFGHRTLGIVRRRIPDWRKAWQRIPEEADRFERDIADLSDDLILQTAWQMRTSLRSHGFADPVVGRAFALVREVAVRQLQLRPYDVQLMGGYALLHGMVAEMQTGEGKTLTATLPASTAALAGIPVHIITVNDYLARRDAESMAPVYEALGLSVGVVASGMEPHERRAAYGCDVTYCTNKEVGFDYLRDRILLRQRAGSLRLRLERLAGGRRTDQLVHRGLRFAIVDEADSVLIDEARTPLIISHRESDDTEAAIYRTALEMARSLQRGRDFEITPGDRQIRLMRAGHARLARLAERRDGLFKGPRRREEMILRALTAIHLFTRDQHYLVDDEKVQIIDEYTGRVMADRSWEQGLHQMIEMKENVPISGRQDAMARISYQRFFRRYVRLAGMTGTAREVGGELWSNYRVPVVRIPTHRPNQRVDFGQKILTTSRQKWHVIVSRIEAVHAEGRPVLVGTRSVAASEELSALLTERNLPHVVLNARMDDEEAEIIAAAGQRKRITVATNMAGRGTDIRLAPGVAQSGGLHVIATERHDASRIDRQLFGRCARQGDPGTTEAIVCLEDDLIEQHSDALNLRILEAVRSGESEPRRRLRALVIRRAQRTAERRHAAMRRDLLRTDLKLESMLAFSGPPE